MIGSIVSNLGQLVMSASEANLVLPPFGSYENKVLLVVFWSAIIALIYGVILVFKVMAQPAGPKALTDVSDAIEQGSMAYLKQQSKIMSVFVLIVFLTLLSMYYYGTFREDPKRMELSWGIALAFVAGVLCSYGAGFVGMKLAVKGNVRTANAALTSFSKCLRVSFDAGAVSGMFTVGFGLLGATIIFWFFKQDAMKVLVGFGFGGSLAALFMRVGGGIYTKAADVGADLVGKVEAGIPEDDPRNAATIADNVGDNVGDCAGMAADMFESYEVTLVAAIILAASLGTDKALPYIMFALLIRALGIFTSIVGTWFVRGNDNAKVFDPMKPIVIGYCVSAALSIIGFFLLSYWRFYDGGASWLWVKLALVTSIGIVLAVATLILTNIFTHPDKRAVTETAIATKTGPATLILNGLAEGMESSVWAIVLICGTIVSSLIIFKGDPGMAAFGVALSGLGLLATTGFVLAMDTFGPITDNAHGIFEMSKIKAKKASDTLAWMDAIGNTTKALTKGLAIATAVIAATALFRSYIDEAKLVATGIQINIPEIFVGLMI
ncbi:MAG: pyrophosphatase, partial [Candidatus Firestonebacteria bacterium RIFOXYA2_FULL_40_8]